MNNTLTPYEALIEAEKIAGGQSALARICDITQPTIWKMIHSSKRLGAQYVLKVEAATGVSRHLLRPDIYPRTLAPVPVSETADQTPLCNPIVPGRDYPRKDNPRGLLDRKGEAA